MTSLGRSPVPTGFDRIRALMLADQILSEPPARQWITRIPGRGRCVERFVLPLELVQSTNRTGRKGMASQPWKIEKLKRDAYLLMLTQLRERPSAPLPGRPMIRCIRFSCSEPDRFNNGFKIAVDRLRAAKGGLGLIVDDKPKYCDEHQWWEFGPRGQGFGLVEVWTG